MPFSGQNIHVNPKFVREPPQKRSRLNVPTQKLNGAPPASFNEQVTSRIFVDGMAYEVFFPNNVAVIERNGVPHRISFVGPPHDVIIDGIAHKMAFGETVPIMIDGHVHFMRFGEPSREFYLGDFPFRAIFGGPPFYASINGRRHEIRLCGPVPEIKIDQDPAYELMKNMQNFRQNKSFAVEQPKKQEKDMSIGDFLTKLQKSGVLDILSVAVNTKSLPSSSAISYPKPPELKPPTIPCKMNLDDTFEVRANPVALLSQFRIADLKVRYLSVIDNIHKQQSTCPECGIFVEDMNSTDYYAHVDEHVQMDINFSAVHPLGKSRQRYLDEKEWIGYSRC